LLTFAVLLCCPQVVNKAIQLSGDPNFNISSRPDKSALIFETLGVPTAGVKKLKKGGYTTEAKVRTPLTLAF
jgi:DNA polymerase I-like protein with 3'-5' exonuclease and polymerase domains